MKKILMLVMVYFCCTPSVFAANGVVTNGKVSVIAVNKSIGNRVLVKMTGTKERQPSCHSAGSWSFVLPLESELDKAMLSLLIAAKASQSRVTLEGTGQCEVHSTIETLNYITSYE